MLKKFLFVLIPVLISPIILLLFSLFNSFYPLDVNVFGLMTYIGLPIIYLIFIYFSLTKIKPSLSIKYLIIFLVFSFVYLILTFTILSDIFVPNLAQVSSFELTPTQQPTEYRVIINNSAYIGFGYVLIMFVVFLINRLQGKL